MNPSMKVNITDAITSENVDLLKELLQRNDCPWNRIEDFLRVAIEIGNMEVLQVLMEKSTYRIGIIETYVLRRIPYLHHSEDKKLEMIKYLLPYCLAQKSNPIKDLFDVVLYCCQKKNFILVEFFINTFYSEEHNSLYPLIKKLQAIVDDWHQICIFLHDDINEFDIYDPRQFDVVQTFKELILKDSPESTELAVETMMVLLDKKVEVRYFLDIAIKTGNMKFFQIVMEKMLLKGQVNVEESVLHKISRLNHDEAKKLEMVKRLLPYVHSIDSNSPRFNPGLLISVMMVFCNSKNFILAEFLFDKLYSADRNKLYPLIQKLKVAVDKWHHVCILLHEGFHQLGVYDVGLNLLLKIVKTFMQLLLKDNRESMELAVETFQILLNKNVYECLIYHPDDQHDEQELFLGWDENISTNIVQALSDSLTKKLLFQLIYNSINDQTQERIYQIMDLWLMTHHYSRHLNQIFNLSWQFLTPFISNPLRDLLLPYNYYKVYQNQQRSAQNSVRSLQELSRDVIRSQVVQNVSNIKEFMDRIWEFKLPTTVKCFVLHIPDPSWMNNAQMS